MKKLYAVLVLALLLLLPLGACEKTGELLPKPEQEEEIIPEPEEVEPANNYKIAFCTQYSSLDEEVWHCAQKAVDIYGQEKINHYTGKGYSGPIAQEGVKSDFASVATKPNPFVPAGKEEVIGRYLGLAKDLDIKVVISNNNRFAAEAFGEVRKIRPDILLIAITPSETDTISQFADIVMQIDELAGGHLIPRQAQRLGAKTLVHYSFERHMSYPILSKRRDMMKEVCQEIGLEFVYAEAIDPYSDKGIPGAQQFILDDMPRKVEEYGKDTAFFATNCAMQEPLIRAAMEQKAIVAQQCCPSPYHGYPGALAIEVPEDKAGDMLWMNEQIHSRLAEGKYEAFDWSSRKTEEVEFPIGMGRFSTWPVPVAMVMGMAAVEYGMAFIEGRVGTAVDRKLLQECLQKAMLIYGYGDYQAYMTTHEDFGNFFQISEDYIIY